MSVSRFRTVPWLLVVAASCTGAALGGVDPASPPPANAPAASTAPAPSAPSAKPEAPPLAAFVSPADSLPRLRYLADGLVTLNDRCPVRKVKLNPRMHAAYVNGFPVGFC